MRGIGGWQCNRDRGAAAVDNVQCVGGCKQTADGISQRNQGRKKDEQKSLTGNAALISS